MKSKKKLWIRFVIIMAFAVLFLLFALFAGKFAPYDPLETHYTSHPHNISLDQLVISAGNRSHCCAADSIPAKDRFNDHCSTK